MILHPLIEWTVETDRAGRLDAELAYVSGGLNWSADYNIVSGDGNALEIIGWVTMENSSGKEFENARVKLMAGDVNKIQPPANGRGMGGEFRMTAGAYSSSGAPRSCGEDFRRVSPLHPPAPGDPPRQRNQASGIRAGGRREIRSRVHLRRHEDRFRATADGIPT